MSTVIVNPVKLAGVTAVGGALPVTKPPAQEYTTTQRDLLVLDGSNAGFTIFNVTTNQLEEWTGTTWIPSGNNRLVVSDSSGNSANITNDALNVSVFNSNGEQIDSFGALTDPEEGELVVSAVTGASYQVILDCMADDAIIDELPEYWGNSTGCKYFEVIRAKDLVTDEPIFIGWSTASGTPGITSAQAAAVALLNQSKGSDGSEITGAAMLPKAIPSFAQFYDGLNKIKTIVCITDSGGQSDTILLTVVI